MTKLFDELKYRGLVSNVTSLQLEEKLSNGGLTFYIGINPTGDSLRIGHCSSLLCTKRLKGHGRHPIMLIGGATGLIGNPKASDERNMLMKGMLEHNYQCLSRRVETLLDFEMVDSLGWAKNTSVIDFLWDYGKYFNVDCMVNKETVKRRLNTGISYTGFSYMTLQALGFLHLYRDKRCVLWLGRQDQQGNITSGLELIRKKHGADVEYYGLTMPLITKADGARFGKSEFGTIWLDKHKTSMYETCQFLVNSEDERVIDHLKELTFLNKEEIDALEGKMKTEPRFRETQKIPVKEVITFLHGEEGYNKALKTTDTLSRGSIGEPNAGELQDTLKGFEATEIADELTLTDTLVQAGITSSKREAREWINQDSIQISGDKVKGIESIVPSKSTTSEGRTLVKEGKRSCFVISQR